MLCSIWQVYICDLIMELRKKGLSRISEISFPRKQFSCQGIRAKINRLTTAFEKHVKITFHSREDLVSVIDGGFQVGASAFISNPIDFLQVPNLLDLSVPKKIRPRSMSLPQINSKKCNLLVKIKGSVTTV